MKKIIATVIAGIMLASLSVSAFAQTSKPTSAVGGNLVARADLINSYHGVGTGSHSRGVDAEWMHVNVNFYDSDGWASATSDSSYNANNLSVDDEISAKIKRIVTDVEADYAVGSKTFTYTVKDDTRFS